jgi:hypothetical protein
MHLGRRAKYERSSLAQKKLSRNHSDSEAFTRLFWNEGKNAEKRKIENRSVNDTSQSRIMKPGTRTVDPFRALSDGILQEKKFR